MRSLRQKIKFAYIKLMRKAQNRSALDIYTEKHHIFPRSIFGHPFGNDGRVNKNIVHLTPIEHYNAHFMLWLYYKEVYGKDSWMTDSVRRAFWLMSNYSHDPNFHLILNIPCYLYEQLRKEFIESISGENNSMFKVEPWNKGLKNIWSKEQLEKWSKERSGEGHSLYGTIRLDMVGDKNPMKDSIIKEKVRVQMLGDLNPSKRPEVREKQINAKRKKMKSVIRINNNDPNDIKIYESFMAAVRDGFSRSAVWRCLKKAKYFTCQFHKGYIWKYLKEYEKEINNEKKR